jgi:hypothetical protein
MRRLIIVFVGFVILLCGCNSGAAEATATAQVDLVGTLVASTLEAVPSPTTVPPTPTLIVASTSAASPTPGEGSVSGKVCYPSGSSSMTAYFEDSASHIVTALDISGGQPTYTVDLIPATYTAYAWLNDFSQGGSYSKCGASAGCNDATPLGFQVSAGQALTGIDLCDWSHGPFDIPYPPGHPAQSVTGIISGSVSNYPYGSLPRLTIVAFNQANGYWYWIGTASGQSNYTIADLPPGTYQVVAYDSDNHAGGSPVVAVTTGNTTTATISDWGGSYPENPVH